jgi:hypothetical protein
MSLEKKIYILIKKNKKKHQALGKMKRIMTQLFYKQKKQSLCLIID